MDQIFLKVLRLMWAAKISVVKALSLTEVRIDHDVSIDQADIVLCFNEDSEVGHYSAVRKSRKLCELETQSYFKRNMHGLRFVFQFVQSFMVATLSVLRSSHPKDIDLRMT